MTELESQGQRGGVAVQVEISPGELFDKLTILEIKLNKLTDMAQLAHVEREWALLDIARARSIKPIAGLDALVAELRSVNEQLWQTEDDIRRCEREGRFDAAFIALARSVYRTNDRRAEVKREINRLLGAAFSEQKSYAG
ncbi:MAG: DUF6165 family protein [Pseudomonadota bacterium]